MGTSEESLPGKASKPTASTQEMLTILPYHDWSASMQSYYVAGATPPPFYNTPVASPAPGAYLWENQHPMVPYGTPLPYPALYSHGGVYAHPNIVMTQNAALRNTETESMKKSEGASENAGLMGGKSGESGNIASSSGNDGASHSGESARDGSSEASDENANQQGSFNHLLSNGAYPKSNNASRYNGKNPSALVQGKNAIPSTKLNIGMDLHDESPAGATLMKATRNEDEGELKREKRKQSNRESAKRSRLRRQAECEELRVRVKELSNENRTLRKELRRVVEECEKLTSKNNSSRVELTYLNGPDVTLKLQNGYDTTTLHSVQAEDDNTQGKDT